MIGKKIVNSVKRCNNICNIRHKQHKRIEKSIQSQNCHSSSHRKCTMLKLPEIHKIARGKLFG